MIIGFVMAIAGASNAAGWRAVMRMGHSRRGAYAIDAAGRRMRGDKLRRWGLAADAGGRGRC